MLKQFVDDRVIGAGPKTAFQQRRCDVGRRQRDHEPDRGLREDAAVHRLCGAVIGKLPVNSRMPASRTMAATKPISAQL